MCQNKHIPNKKSSTKQVHNHLKSIRSILKQTHYSKQTEPSIKTSNRDMKLISDISNETQNEIKIRKYQII